MPDLTEIQEPMVLLEMQEMLVQQEITDTVEQQVIREITEHQEIQEIMEEAALEEADDGVAGWDTIVSLPNANKLIAVLKALGGEEGAASD
jgi:Asp-tRNA(Asn)/Glu-tRNA(Gln) amidotransferase B subunit